MPKVSEIYPGGDFIRAEDIKGTVLKLTINLVETDHSFDSEDIILGFGNDERKLRLNKTNATTLAQKHGDEANAWIGKEIQLAAVPVQYQGKTVLGTRVIG